MGGIGRNLARKAKVLGMEVIYHNRNRVPDDVEKEIGVRYMGFEELLKESDAVSLNLPLNEETRHLIGGKELGIMKKGAVLVNTARGGVVDEGALVESVCLFQLFPRYIFVISIPSYRFLNFRHRTHSRLPNLIPYENASAHNGIQTSSLTLPPSKSSSIYIYMYLTR